MAAWFRRKDDDQGGRRTRVVTEGLWIKCDSCKEIVYRPEVERAGRVCPKCGYPFRISARERITLVADDGSFEERETGLRSKDPLNFKDTKKYTDRLKAAVGRIRFSIKCGGPEMAPALPQSADIPRSADNRL